MRTKVLWILLKRTIKEWQEDKALRLGAALSFYTIFSLAPLLLIVIGIAGLAFGHDEARSRIMNEIQGLLGQQGGQAVEQILQNAQKPSSGVFATIIGFVTLLLGATGVLAQLRDALNTMWEVKEKAGGGLKGFIRERFWSLAMVLAIGFLLLVSLALSAGLTALAEQWGAAAFLEILNFALSIAVVTVLFALIFKLLPETKVRWRNVWLGAFVTAVLFTLGKTMTGLYLAKSGVASGFGSAGSLVIVLLWVYYNSQVLFVGAEFTQVYSAYRGDKALAELEIKNETEERSIMLEIEKEPDRTIHAQHVEKDSLYRFAYFLGGRTAALNRAEERLQKKWRRTKLVAKLVDFLGVRRSAKLGWKSYKVKKALEQES